MEEIISDGDLKREHRQIMKSGHT